MNRSAIPFLLLLSSCAPQLRYPQADPAAIRQQMESTIRQQLEDSIRLFNVVSLLRTSNSELCGDRIIPTIGFLAVDRNSTIALDRVYGELRANIAGVYSEDLTILHIVPGSPAEIAGMTRGNQIISVNGEPPQEQRGFFSTTYKAKWLEEKIKQNGFSPMIFEMTDPPRSITIQPKPACNYPFGLANNMTPNAMTDGNKITVTSGMLRMIQSDAELAFVVGHEMAHILEDHVAKQRGNQMLGGLLAAALEAGLSAAMRVPASGDLTRAGMMAGQLVYSHDFEKEADYFSLYLLARAGIDISTAPGILSRLQGQSYSASHPSSPERVANMQLAIREIQNKIITKAPLLPERKENSIGSEEARSETKGRE